MLASKSQEFLHPARQRALLPDIAKTTLAQHPGAAESPVQRGRFSLRREYVAICLVILLISGIRFRLRDFPLERDEGEYAYAGQLILQGIPPYQLAYNMKLPGTYAAYAAVMSLFGQTISGIHLGLLLVNAATVALVFFLARRLINETAGLVAAASYALLSISPTVLGFAAHATHFVMLPVLAGMLLLLHQHAHARFGRLFVSGTLFGLAVVMKQPGIFFAVLAVIYLITKEIRRGLRPNEWILRALV